MELKERGSVRPQAKLSWQEGLGHKACRRVLVVYSHIKCVRGLNSLKY